MKTAIGDTETRDSISIKLDFLSQATAVARLVCASGFAYSFLWQLFCR